MGGVFVFWGEADRVGCGERSFDRCIHFRVIDRRVVGQINLELFLRTAQLHPVLGSLGARDRRNYGRQIEFGVLAVGGLDLGVVPQSLQFGIRLDQGDLVFAPAGEAQIFERDVIDGEHRRGRTELRAHVADRGPVRERNGCNARPVEFDELSDDAVLTQHLGDGEHDIRGRHPGGNGA